MKRLIVSVSWQSVHSSNLSKVTLPLFLKHAWWGFQVLNTNSLILQILSGCTTSFGNINIGPSNPKWGISLGFGCLQTTSPTMTTHGILEDRFNAFAGYALSVTSMILFYITESSMYCISKSWACTWSSEVFAILWFCSDPDCHRELQPQPLKWSEAAPHAVWQLSYQTKLVLFWV